MGNVGSVDFDWTPYENGWNGHSLKVNKRVNSAREEEVLRKEGYVKRTVRDKVYCHEGYAQEVYDKLSFVNNTAPVKDIKKGAIASVSDLKVIDKNTVLATLDGGATDVLIDLSKESKFFALYTLDKGEPATKEQFIESLNMPKIKKMWLDFDLLVKVGTDTEKASLWDGWVEKIKEQMREQILLETVKHKKQDRAFTAKIVETNGGGYIVEVQNAVSAFMPGSMAACNKLDDYESLIGKEMEVMVDSETQQHGFVVSRKKFLNFMRPSKIEALKKELAENPNKMFIGKVTGTNDYGVYVELDEYLTGMMHKTLVRDETREAMRHNAIKPQTYVNCYIHKIDEVETRRGKDVRIILSDVPAEEREAVIARREAEDNAEKSQHAETKKQ